MKEIKELLEGVKILAVFGKKVGADGKVSVADLPLLLTLVEKAPQLSAAFQGLDQALDELKAGGLDAVVEILQEVKKGIDEVKAA